MLVSVSLSACAGMPEFFPQKQDTQLMEMRRYKIVDKENAIISKQPIQIIPIVPGVETSPGGMWCVTNEEAIKLRAWYLKKKNDHAELQRSCNAN